MSGPLRIGPTGSKTTTKCAMHSRTLKRIVGGHRRFSPRCSQTAFKANPVASVTASLARVDEAQLLRASRGMVE